MIWMFVGMMVGFLILRASTFSALTAHKPETKKNCGPDHGPHKWAYKDPNVPGVNQMSCLECGKIAGFER